MQVFYWKSVKKVLIFGKEYDIIIMWETTKQIIKEQEQMKNIIKQSRELSKQEIYLLTMSPKNDSMKNHKGERFEVSAWLIFEDVDKKTGELHQVLSVLTPENETFSTVSETFQNDFLEMAELFDNDFSFEVMSGESKSGREFVTCCLAI